MEETITSGKKKQFLNYINVFRGLAILLIIMGHTMQFGADGTLSHIINTEIVCGGTALFIFISGFLFQPTNIRNIFRRMTSHISYIIYHINLNIKTI